MRTETCVITIYGSDDETQDVECSYTIENRTITECKIPTPIVIEPGDLTCDVLDSIRFNESDDYRLRLECKIEYTITSEMVRA